jgi:hypothetical protein
MLTIFTVPKPFRGHIGVIQKNAFASWARLMPACQILVCGEEEGAGEAAAAIGAEFVPRVERNEYGTPLLSHVFRLAGEKSRQPLLCYVNADIVLLPDFTTAAARVAAARDKFLMVGQRWDLDVTEPLPFEAADWAATTRQRARTAGSLHAPAGSDYFVYPKGAMGTLPEFAVGRPGWDNWFLYRARSLRLPVVDATEVTTVIHQNHDYAHVARATGTDWEGPEAVRNRELMGGTDHVFTLLDCTHRLTAHGLARPTSSAHLRRRVASWAALHPALRPLIAAVRVVRRATKGG